MLRAVRLKFLFLFILTVVAIMFVLPSLTGGLPDWWEKHVSRGLKLGLDLKGGMHLILQVDMESAVRNALNRDANDLKEMAEKRGLTLKIGDVAKEKLPVTVLEDDCSLTHPTTGSVKPKSSFADLRSWAPASTV